ncbi:N-acetylmuramate/N-acetylglucosamine kinase [Sinobacterium norvegicum]|uniref:N-acetylmuramate/N-acetylglucosamine kinase n=1 Tax=Sinobacterium norvegicum TaxID=1641715 RepID=A0ABM9AE50_9GAMM|nr:phosphotransferase [Sinobacterium norvegicum]CAH0991476.1 N-acetylmuramate/N-acetylglucosamine kinase [Sinobacterium norvegicum]
MSFEALLNWSREQLPELIDQPYQWLSVSGDASFRVYYRLSYASGSYIAVSAPPEKEKNHEFVAIAQGLVEAGVKAPAIIAADFEQGFLLQQDFGDQLLLPLLSAESADHWYTASMDLMWSLSRSHIDNLPLYSDALLAQEFQLFADWFVDAQLGYRLAGDEQAMLDRLERKLNDSALSQPQVVVHRDFHARNIMAIDGELAVIDFQDAVIGPVTYDLVSLLKDCYIRWPRAQVITWVEQYRLQYQQQTGQTFDTGVWLKWFDLMGMQRHIKVLGIFCRLNIRDNKQAYLADLPRVIEYVQEVSGLYDELAEFSGWFERTMVPLIVAQGWGDAA